LNIVAVTLGEEEDSRKPFKDAIERANSGILFIAAAGK
jgi:hypothetical protein